MARRVIRAHAYAGRKSFQPLGRFIANCTVPARKRNGGRETALSHSNWTNTSDRPVYRLNGRRMNERKWNAAMFAIDRKIGIQRQHGVLLIDLGHSYDTRISQRHRSVPVFLMQFA